MISWIRRRLTYANVVSTICLFIVLGGTAYAATSATSANAANSAATANTANSANTAATATHALTADTATTANSATNALALGGLDSSFFERSSRTQFGFARDDINTQTVLLSWPQ